MFGVCCTNPVKPAKPSDSSTTEVTIENVQNETNSVYHKVASPYYPQIPNWPPPLPTHPPDHTIPPLPTHPPSPGFPSQTTTNWPPNKPVTTKPPKKPVTTKPPYKPPTTTTSLPSLPASSSCGAKNGYQDQERIVGGHNADVNEWPWIAALFNGGRQFCGGSLIDSVHILSAAHCVAQLALRGGRRSILYNDIAILTLDSPVEFSQQIRPVCLPNGSGDHSGKTGTVIGWGSLRESGPQPAVLQEVNIPIWNNRDCKLKYGPAAPGGIVEHMLCAGQANRDSCSALTAPLQCEIWLICSNEADSVQHYAASMQYRTIERLP
ncbi:hypothetical protein NQ314_017662 [Rhamnusium bicolor]|uniref:Peptidase S1 domain-containing protein n=1 Tax=Rhamnusium bicolor TaxID=1586634 RepID=A0AAV8WS55_9CUCU|nr:hypothetical protein NQ314_017662 [Rhamnusium bicolor]